MKAIVMAGGQGTRFWPMSRRSRPKQFLSITGSRTLLQETVDRLPPLLGIEEVYVVCGERYLELVRLQLPELTDRQIIVEPVGRNTAPCVGLAARRLSVLDPEEPMLVLPADHVVQDREELQAAFRAAERAAREGWLVTFGIRPTHAATGYGYVEKGETIGRFFDKTAYRARRFTEKPDRETARRFLDSGRFFWNSGMFVWTPARILEEIETHLPSLASTLTEIDRLQGDRDAVTRLFSSVEPVSIDYGIMERAERVAVIPCSPGWNDVGSWKAVAEVLPADEKGIVSDSPYVEVEGRDCVLYTGGKTVALLGVRDLVVVDTQDAILVCHRERTEEVRRIIEELRRRERDDLL